jgi:multidrug efflux pump subunit AcrB
MEEEQVITPEPAPAPVADANDPFVLDEAKFASLSPEQRAAMEPVITEWKSKAKSEIEKTNKTWESKYKPTEEKARALDELVKDQRFVAWWQQMQQVAAPQGQPNRGGAVQPKDIATADEWQQAIAEAYAGNGMKMQEIQTRLVQAMAGPYVQDLRNGQEELKTTLEMNDLFKNHPDAIELDKVGRNTADPDDKSMSLLEMALEWADNNGKRIEDGYQLAKKWADAMRVGAKQEAMGMVQEKKESVTSGKSTTNAGQGVVEVEDTDELMSKRMEYSLRGEKAPKFVIRQSQEPSKTRWAQRT